MREQQKMIHDPAILAELFTANHLQRIAWYGWSDELTTTAAMFRTRGWHGKVHTIGDLLDVAFRVLHREYPVEYVYKSCMLRKTIFGKHAPNTTSLYIEFPVGNARADALLVNGDASVFEIKSKYDNPSRLTLQIEEYYKCFRYVTLLTDSARANSYISLLPQKVGVAILSSRYTISTLRPATPHEDSLDQSNILRLLRQQEYSNILKSYGVNIDEIDPSDRYLAASEFFIQLPVQDAYRQLVSALRQRQRTEKLATLCKALPDSVHACVFSYRMRIADWGKLQCRLTEPLPV